MYRLRDEQFAEERYFGGDEGVIFKSKRDILDHLVDYHDIDFQETDDKDNELSITEYFGFHKINSMTKQLSWILDYGQWKIEKVSKKTFKRIREEENRRYKNESIFLQQYKK